MAGAAGEGPIAGRAAPPLVPIPPDTAVEDDELLPAPLLSFAEPVGSVGDGDDTGEDVDVRLERCEFDEWLLLLLVETGF